MKQFEEENLEAAIKAMLNDEKIVLSEGSVTILVGMFYEIIDFCKEARANMGDEFDSNILGLFLQILKRAIPVGVLLGAAHNKDELKQLMQEVFDSKHCQEAVDLDDFKRVICYLFRNLTIQIKDLEDDDLYIPEGATIQ